MSVKIFCCYAHEDEPLLKKLKAHLRPLQRQELIDVWHDRDISAGTEWEQEIIKHLNEAQIILLLISPDFMNSDYCYSKEMSRAIERHERGEARVIPIILRPVYWQGSPIGKLQALPKDGKPVTDPDWHNLDRAFFDVAEGIRKVAEMLSAQSVKGKEDELADTSIAVQKAPIVPTIEQARQETTDLLEPAPVDIPHEATYTSSLEPLVQSPQQSSSQVQSKQQLSNVSTSNTLFALISVAVIAVVIGGIFLLASPGKGAVPSPTPTPTRTMIFASTQTAETGITATLSDAWVNVPAKSGLPGNELSARVGPRDIVVFTGAPITFEAIHNGAMVSYSFPNPGNEANILAFVNPTNQGTYTAKVTGLISGSTDQLDYTVPQGIRMSSAEDVVVLRSWKGMSKAGSGNCGSENGCSVEYYAVVDVTTNKILTSNVSHIPQKG